MNIFDAPDAVLFSAAEVCRAVGLEEWAVRKLHPGVFPCQGNWLERDGALFYTAAGVLALAVAAERRGYPVMAHSLRVLARDRCETPSRALVPPGPKNAPVHHPWMDRADVNG